MKKLVNIISVLAAMIFHCSCISEEIVQDKPASGIRVYSDWAETRTSHQSSNGVTSVSWVEGDKIGIFAENQYNLCYIAENSGSFSDFTASDVSLDAADGDKVFAYYPYEQWTDQDGKSFRLPRTQGQWSSLGMSRYDALYAEEAVSNDELNLKFKHVFSFLKITVPTERLVRDSESGYYVLRLVSNEMLSNIEGNFNVETKEFDANCTTDVLYIIDKDIAGKSNVTCTVAILPQTGAANISIYACADNFSVENLLHTIDVPDSGLEAGKVYTLRIIDEQQAAEREKSVEALTALYNATDGDNWKNNTNWLTDEPLYKWYGLNANYWPESTIEVDDIVEIQLFDNNLRGTLPPEFAYIMSKANAIEIESNGLHGVIPQEVREHPKWQKFGWNVIMQNPYLGGGFDFSEGTGLKLTDVEMPFFVENEARKASDVFAENELTLAVNVGLVDEMQGISEGVVDYYKKYQNKDLGMIVTVGGYWDYTYDEYRNYVLEERAKGLPEEIMWIGSQISSLAGQSMSYNGAMHLFDKESNLLGVWIGGSSESWEQIDAIVSERLGEPEVDGDSSEDNTLELVSVTDDYDNYKQVILQFATPGVTASVDPNTWQVTYTGTGKILNLVIHAEKNEAGYLYIPAGTYAPADDTTNPYTWQITAGLSDWNLCWGTHLYEVVDGNSTMVHLSEGTVDVDCKDGVYTITYKGQGYELTYEGPLVPSAGDDNGNDEELTAGYSAWLGDWIITGANGIQQYVTFSKGKANETFIMSGYEGDEASGLDVTVNWLEEDGIWVIYNQMLGTYNFSSYGNGDVWFVGEGETANIYLSEIPICLGRTLEDGSFAAYGYEEEYELEDGTPMSYKVVSMEYLAYLTDYGQLSYITSTYTTGYPTFPMTFTKIDAKSGDTDFVVQKHSFGKREKKFSVLHGCYPADGQSVRCVQE